jgi:hypothetical protein
LDKTLRLALIAGALLAGFGVFYHFVIYLPGKDRDRQQAYAKCADNVHKQYAEDWAAGCKALAETRAEQVKLCKKIGPPFGGSCENFVGEVDQSPECRLPNEFAEPIEQRQKQSLEQCATVANLGS